MNNNEKLAETEMHGAKGRCSGFTLIELMIVVAIIGILAAIAIPNFLGMQEKAKRRAMEESVSSTKAELQNWLDASVKGERGVVDLNGNGVVGPLESPCSSLANVARSWIWAMAVKKGRTPLSPWYRKPLFTTIHGVYSGGIVLSRTSQNMGLKIIGYSLNGTTLVVSSVAID